MTPTPETLEQVVSGNLNADMAILDHVRAWKADKLRLVEAEKDRDKWRGIASAMNDEDSWIGKECGFPQDAALAPDTPKPEGPFAGVVIGGQPVCPECGVRPSEGHAHGCPDETKLHLGTREGMTPVQRLMADAEED